MTSPVTRAFHRSRKLSQSISAIHNDVYSLFDNSVKLLCNAYFFHSYAILEPGIIRCVISIFNNFHVTRENLKVVFEFRDYEMPNAAILFFNSCKKIVPIADIILAELCIQN